MASAKALALSLALTMALAAHGRSLERPRVEQPVQQLVF